MSIPFPSAKERTLNRAKALIELLLPCLALAMVVVLSFGSTPARPALIASKATGGTSTRQDGWLLANTASSSDATVDITQEPKGMPGKTAGKNGTATTIITYTFTPTY